MPSEYFIETMVGARKIINNNTNNDNDNNQKIKLNNNNNNNNKTGPSSWKKCMGLEILLRESRKCAKCTI